MTCCLAGTSVISVSIQKEEVMEHILRPGQLIALKNETVFEVTEVFHDPETNEVTAKAVRFSSNDTKVYLIREDQMAYIIEKESYAKAWDCCTQLRNVYNEVSSEIDPTDGYLNVTVKIPIYFFHDGKEEGYW